MAARARVEKSIQSGDTSPHSKLKRRIVSADHRGVGDSRAGRGGNLPPRPSRRCMGVDEPHAGLEQALTYPLFAALANRRSRRISKGLAAVHAGSLTYRPAVVPKPEPLSPLEEAVLIAATGTTGVTLPDRPFEDGSGNKILGTPNLTMLGRAAGSTDNAQATHFFL